MAEKELTLVDPSIVRKVSITCLVSQVLSGRFAPNVAREELLLRPGAKAVANYCPPRPHAVSAACDPIPSGSARPTEGRWGATCCDSVGPKYRVAIDRAQILKRKHVLSNLAK